MWAARFYLKRGSEWMLVMTQYTSDPREWEKNLYEGHFDPFYRTHEGENSIEYETKLAKWTLTKEGTDAQ